MEIELNSVNTSYYSSKSLLRFLLALGLLFFIGCGEKEVVSGLDPRERVAVLSAFQENGISSREQSFVSGKSNRYSLFVSEGEYSRAIKILSQLGLPKREGVDKNQFDDSMIPPTPEVLALKLELISGERLRDLLRAIPGIIDVEVLFRRSSDGSRISIFARHSADAAPDLAKSIREITLRTFPEVSDDRLEIQSFGLAGSPDEPIVKFPSPFSFHVMKGERALAVTEVFTWLGGSILLALFVGFYGGLHVSTLFWRRVEKRRAERRRTGEYAIVPVKTASSLQAIKETD